MLASRRGERAFLQERGFADDDVADFLGLTDMPDLASYDLETARSALRELVAATGDLASDRLPASVEANLQAIAATFSFEQLSTRLLLLVAILENVRAVQRRLPSEQGQERGRLCAQPLAGPSRKRQGGVRLPAGGGPPHALRPGQMGLRRDAFPQHLRPRTLPRRLERASGERPVYRRCFAARSRHPVHQGPAASAEFPPHGEPL